jgi:Beta-lactamase enzyme family
MKVRFFIAILSCIVIFSDCSTSKNNLVVIMDGKQNMLSDILNQYPAYFDSVIKRKDELKLQIIYTQIDRKKNGKADFKDYYFNVDDSSYFYPASTVKLPIAILTLQKLNELKVAGLDMNSVMITGEDDDGQTPVLADSTAQDNKPAIAHYIKKILLVSDNDAFNRLYEFLGQEYINNTLHKMGYTGAQIIHRLNISLTEQQNRHTNPVKFYNRIGQLIYEKPAEKSKVVYAQRNTKIGKGYMKGDSLVNEPLDFSKKNRLLLKDLHSIVRSIMFPQTVSLKQRFDLTEDDYNFLRHYMSMTPLESDYPSYDTVNYHDNYVKFLYYGSEKVKTNPGIRIFNKVGDAYGFLIDAAYIADFKNNIEFQLSAVIYCNSDGILNDDKYDYESMGFPFMKRLGQVIYDYELKRKRTLIPDLSTFKFNYKK